MPRPKTYDDELRERLVARAATMIAHGGVEALSLRPLAAAEGTSTSAVYAMVGDRAALVDAVAARARDSFVAAQQASPTTAEVPTDLLALGHAYRDWALAHPALYVVMFGGRLPLPPGCGLDVAADEAIASLRAIVERAAAQGILFGGEACVLAATVSIWAGVHGLVSLEIAEGLDRPDDARSRFEGHLASIGRGWRTG